MSSLLCCYSPSFSPSLIPELPHAKKFQIFASSNQSNDNNNNSTKLVTFLGKGGSGKTTSSVFAAQHFAMAGLATCLVLHSQDPTAEYLLNCKIGTSPTVCNKNLSAVRLESTKMLLEPLKRLKEADARLNMTQGFLGGIVGEELGVLLGMDSIFSALAVERYLGVLGILAQKDRQKDKFDVIIFDGMSSEEILRMIGTPSKSRLYLKYLRSMAEKTDIGRLTGPSLLRLVDEAINSSRSSSPLNGKLSSEIWDTLEQKLERGSSALAEALGCYLVMDTHDPASINSALRYWGCAIQAGAQVSGAFAIPSKHQSIQSLEKVKDNFLPLPFASIPQLPTDATPDWNSIVLGETARCARDLLSSPTGPNRSMNPSVNFDMVHKTVTLLMPGFDKSEVKLYQYRGGSELLVEAGDQRRIINLPPKIQGKVAGAKFIDRNLIITMR